MRCKKRQIYLCYSFQGGANFVGGTGSVSTVLSGLCYKHSARSIHLSRVPLTLYQYNDAITLSLPTELFMLLSSCTLSSMWQNTCLSSTCKLCLSYHAIYIPKISDTAVKVCDELQHSYIREMTIGRNAFPDKILFIKNDMSFSDPYDVCPNILSLMTTVLKKKSKFGTKGPTLHLCCSNCFLHFCSNKVLFWKEWW